MTRITDLPASFAGKTVHVWDEYGEISGELETVTYEWGVPEDSWGGNTTLTGIRLKVGQWEGSVSLRGHFEVLDSEKYLKELWERCRAEDDDTPEQPGPSDA